MTSKTSRSLLALALTAAIVPAAIAVGNGAALAGSTNGSTPSSAVFVGTNHNNTDDPSQPANEIAYYSRASSGALSLVGTFPTGGQGSGPSQRFAGDGLGAGNSVQVSDDKRFLLVTNAGSNDVSVLKIKKNGLQLVDREPTGDGSADHRFPNSVTQRGDTVYVLNSADEGSITGFHLSRSGDLTPIAGSTRTLDANNSRFSPDPIENPTQVSFTPDGSQLLVSIKDGPKAGLLPGYTPSGPGRVLVFGVGGDDRPSPGYVQNDFANRGPFGFSFDPRGNLLIAEFLGGRVIDGGPTGSAGSYSIGDDGRLTAITSAVSSDQIDTCWVVNNGKYAFGSNYGSGTVSSWTVAEDGSLTLLKAVAGTTEPTANIQGSTPLDLRTSPDGTSLYNVLPGSGKVAAWSIGADGSLTKLGEYGGVPQTVYGDHAPSDFGAGGSPAGIDVI